MRHRVVVVINFDVIVEMHLGLFPLPELIAVSRQRFQCRLVQIPVMSVVCSGASRSPIPVMSVGGGTGVNVVV
jgi:hypothetical protein